MAYNCRAATQIEGNPQILVTELQYLTFYAKQVFNPISVFESRMEDKIRLGNFIPQPLKAVCGQIIFVTFLANYTQALLLSKYIDSRYLVRTTPTIYLLLFDSSFSLKTLTGGHKFSEFAC